MMTGHFLERTMGTITTHTPLVEADKVWQLPEADAAHFMATINRAARHAELALSVDIYLNERKGPRVHNDVVYEEGGWLEYTVVIKWKAGGSLVIGAIQRTLGADSEFHS